MIFRLAVLAAIVVAATGCPNNYRAKTNGKPMTVDQRLVGIWDLSAVSSSPNVPTRIWFTNESGVTMMEFCAQNGGDKAVYKLRGMTIAPDQAKKIDFAPTIKRLNGRALQLEIKIEENQVENDVYNRNTLKEAAVKDPGFQLCQ